VNNSHNAKLLKARTKIRGDASKIATALRSSALTRLEAASWRPVGLNGPRGDKRPEDIDITANFGFVSPNHLPVRVFCCHCSRPIMALLGSSEMSVQCPLLREQVVDATAHDPKLKSLNNDIPQTFTRSALLSAEATISI